MAEKGKSEIKYNRWWVCRKIAIDIATDDVGPGQRKQAIGQSAYAFFVVPFFDWLKNFFFIQICNVWRNEEISHKIY